MHSVQWLDYAETRAHEPNHWHTSVSGHMTGDSSPGTPEAPRASRTDKNDELDANIRNFAPVARIMKNALPDNAKIAKEAKECMQECVSEFISFITSEGMYYQRNIWAARAANLLPNPVSHGLAGDSLPAEIVCVFSCD